MLMLPAIDIKNGKVVRLFQGKFDMVTEYGADPLDMAKYWQDQGAQYLHVVDLDGAGSGERRNQDIIKNIAQQVKIPVETGGGIRSIEAVNGFLSSGIARVILGTKVVEDPVFIEAVLHKWNDKIAVSLDCLNGLVAQRGWAETSNVKGVDLAKQLADQGLKYVIYTDISRDGTMAGPDTEGLIQMLSVSKDLNVIASGGIKSIDDIKLLLALKADNLWGVITGKAIYEGALDLKAALKLTGVN